MSFKPMLCEKADIKQVEEGLFDDGVWLAQKKYDGILEQPVDSELADGETSQRSFQSFTHS